VFLRALQVEAEIGLHSHEIGRPQPLLVDIEVELEPAVVGSIRDTLNYELLARHARALAAAGHIELVETFAQQLAERCVQEPRALAVRVRVEKPQAIAGAAAAGVEVRLRRS
jgi:dihydroneopterin aldolase